MESKVFDFVYCCLREEQEKQVRDAMRCHTPAAVSHAQENLLKQTHGYRCRACGREFPFLRLEYGNALADPKTYAKPTGCPQKGKKAADIFGGTFYYAKSNKELLKFELSSDGTFRQTDSIPVMKDVYHATLSRDGRYIATETFGGTICVIDVNTKQVIGKKSGSRINGSFIFTEDNKLLYFHEDAVWCWDVPGKKERILWYVPEQWKKSDDPKKPIHIVCRNAFHNESEQACIFELGAGDATYAAFFRNLEWVRSVTLPGGAAASKMVFSEGINQYTLSEKGTVNVYDTDFQLVEQFTPPVFHKIHDGGGVFPVTRHRVGQPDRTFLSPDGKWLLLDYFNYLILMSRWDRKIRFCLFSYTGKVAQHMGFVDRHRFWYTWGDTTYIQKMQ